MTKPSGPDRATSLARAALVTGSLVASVIGANVVTARDAAAVAPQPQVIVVRRQSVALPPVPTAIVVDPALFQAPPPAQVAASQGGGGGGGSKPAPVAKSKSSK